MGSFTRTLDQVDAGSRALVGGKGANLGELVALGVPVPAAFCVTTEAYRSFVDKSGVAGKIATALGEIDYRDPASIADVAASVRDLILAAEMAPDIGAEISRAYARLEADLGPSVPVAVRSSATAEDLPGASFAGQQDTYLNVADAGPVVDAVKRCWASLWTDRAIAYRHSRGFQDETVLLAVVVQHMFDSEVAGVLFTANPVTSNPEEFFVNASWGLGEAIVSGRVNPDQLIVDKVTLDITDRQIHDKLVMTVRDVSGQGSIEVPVANELTKVQSLPDEAVRELCRIGARIEDHYGFYQDIEWGYADGRLVVLQTREITGADLDFGHALEIWKTPRALAGMYDERWVWSRAYSDEVQTGPSTPSFYTYLQSGMTHLKASALRMTATPNLLEYTAEEFLDFPYFRWYGARAYYNLAFERERIRLFIPPFARTQAALWPFPEAERDEIRNLAFDWAQFFQLLRRLQRENPGISLLGTTQVVYANLKRWTDEEDAFWTSFDLENATVPEIFAAQAASRGESRFGENVVLPFTIYLFILPAALEMVCRSWLGDEDGQIYNRLVGGLQTKTVEENIAVWALSRLIKASPTLTALIETTDDGSLLSALRASEEGRGFLRELDAFISAYGHRGGAERDAYHPRWRDEPRRVFQSIRVMLALDDEHSPELHERRLRNLMLETKTSCIQKLERRGDSLEPIGWLTELNQLAEAPVSSPAELFAWLVELVQDYSYYRDFERFYNDKTMSRSRGLYEAIGRKFVARQLLGQVDDVFFLGREEMQAVDAGEIAGRQAEIRVRERRRVYEKYTRREPPKYIRGWITFDDAQLAAEGALSGIGASSGVVKGRARVCRDLSDVARVEQGDILVTVATDPGWTTVFSILGGVVVETGGVVAHAVMISREYGLPCVANLSQACDLISDGATITVDGNTGTVVIHGEPAAATD